jgi:hypothetical protein
MVRLEDITVLACGAFYLAVETVGGCHAGL